MKKLKRRNFRSRKPQKKIIRLIEQVKQKNAGMSGSFRKKGAGYVCVFLMVKV
ncbi:hypothetical protein [Halobacillus sp. K22]|uniref:hypothetical protein n=1 Tax=Halobacillus sp. K22 TaxID=3457431 RepID=UPI003FCDDDC7